MLSLSLTMAKNDAFILSTMTKLEQILETFPHDEFVTLDGLDDAVIGVNYEVDPPRLVYSINEITECFVKNNGMTEEEAIEHYEYNTARSIPYVKNAPMLIYTEFF